MYSHSNNIFFNELEPSEFYLSPNYPNPFKEKTTIKYCVPYRIKVLLAVYNDENHEVIKLVNEEKNAGTYEVVFQPKVDSRQLASGIYYYRLEAGDYKNEMEMLLIK